MEEIVAVAVFGLGATVGVKAAGAIGGGLRPLMRAALVGGIMAASMARTAASRAGEAMADTTTSAQHSLQQIKAEAEAELAGSRRPPAGTSSGPRRIRVVKEEQES